MRGTPATEGGQTGRAHPHSLVLSHSISISRSHSAEPRPNCQVKVTVACEWNFKSLLASSYTMRDPTKGVLGLWCNLWTCWVSMVVHLLNLTCQTLHRLILFLHCVERSEWGRRLDRSVWAGEKKKENSEWEEFCAPAFYSPLIQGRQRSLNNGSVVTNEKRQD